MNLLVTNTSYAQAYLIIRAMRPYADKVVVTMDGKSKLQARMAHAANSRFVDKRYYVPSPVEDWRAGRIQRENTEREEAYVQAVLDICRTEKIDTIFPSFDPHVYVFSKNKERFDRLGVVIPIPDYEIVIKPLDKYRTIQAAQEVGFPCPKTYLPENRNHLRSISAEIGFPLVIKPRFTSGGRGTFIVRDFGELTERMQTLWTTPLRPMIQEYIPGKDKQQFFLILDKSGNLRAAFCPHTHRLFDRVYRNSSLASESAELHAFTPQAITVARHMGSWGSINVQSKIDARDKLPKLLEFNPRLGNHSWYMAVFGINEPLMCLEIARGNDVSAIQEYGAGTMLLSPVEELYGFAFWILDQAAFKLRTRVFGLPALDPLNAPLSLKQMLQSYVCTYRKDNRKAFDPYFRYCLQDPLVSILWWLRCWHQFIAAAKRAGR